MHGQCETRTIQMHGLIESGNFYLNQSTETKYRGFVHKKILAKYIFDCDVAVKTTNAEPSL